jgi:hypothetical protein
MVEVPFVRDEGGLVGVGGVHRAGRADIDDDLGAFGGMEQVCGGGDEIAGDAAVVEAEIIQRPELAVPEDAGIAGEAGIGAAGATGADWY